MKILIVENEIYLAQSIAAKLTESGHICEIVATMHEALKNEKYGAILLSTNISGQNFYPIIEKHKDSIIILMISYISNDTVSNPMKVGANDYILKPFMIEELIRKLQHLKNHERFKKENRAYKEYFKFIFENTKTQEPDTKISLPLLIKTNYQKLADSYAFNYAKENNEILTFTSLASDDAIETIQKCGKKELLYLVNFQNIKRSEKTKVLNLISGKRAIISTTDTYEDLDINTISLQNDNKVIDGGDILSIDDYVKFIILNFQNKFPDTELSKKLGISRKSLWEKRKKYGISKKK